MIPGAWAKLIGGKSLLVADHGTDVAAVFEALLDAGWSERLTRVADRSLAEEERARMLAAAFLHDMGKTNAGFWRRQVPGWPSIGHLVPMLAAHEVLQTLLVELVEGWGGDDLFLAMLAHHRRPVVEPGSDQVRLWNAEDGYDPIAELSALLTMARHRHPSAFGRQAQAPDPRMASLFAGLLTLSDWIGSSPERFPIDGVTGEERGSRSRRTAAAAVRSLGLATEPDLRRAAGTVRFADVFGYPDPRPMQTMASRSDLGRLAILEAETGSGKTEAALWRFLGLLGAGEVDGLYFALPTRTSAVQMHARLRRAMDAVFGEGGVPVTLAVPGYLRAGGAEGQRLSRWDVLWPDDPDDALRDARWAAEAPKQFLAARVAVGTVDQALLSGLQVKHAHVRAACLSRSLLVVDEVHASDAYMTEVLAQVLDNHLGAGGHALLLSATLGAAARARLTGGRRALPPPLAEAERLAYPAIHGTSLTFAPGSDTAPKQVVVELVPAIGNPVIPAARALATARAGGRVLVLRNTVKDAVAMQAALETALGDHDLLWSSTTSWACS